MVMKDLKEMMGQGSGIKDEPDDEKGDMSLFNLVRGGNDKKRVNFLVTSSEGGREYVPSRYSSMMINAREGKESFVPRRGRSGNEKGDEDPNKKDETHSLFSLFGSKRKKANSPGSSSSDGSSSDEETRETPKRKGQGGKGQRVQISKLRLNRTRVCLRPAQISKLRLCQTRLYLRTVDVPLLVEAWMLPPAVRSPKRAHPGRSGRGELMMPSLFSLRGVD